MMKKLVIGFLGYIVMTVNTMAQEIDIKINVTGIDVNRGGNIIVMIFGEKGFPKIHKQALADQTKRANKDSLEFKFTLNTLNNELAMKVLHDENGDNKVTKNWTGVFPKEGLGFSNGQKISITGPPTYNKSKLPKDQLKTVLIIPIRYP